MFTISHLIWIIICITIITIALIYLNKHKPSLKNFLTISCVICFISEMIKFFSTIQLVPSSDGSMYYPFIEQQHLPLHLCSLQILLIFYARFAKDSERKEMLLAFMYPTWGGQNYHGPFEYLDVDEASSMVNVVISLLKKYK